MRFENWKCDGCGLTAEAEVRKTPEGWTQARVTLQGMAKLSQDELYDVCATCQMRLYLAMQSEHWGKLGVPIEQPIVNNVLNLGIDTFELSIRPIYVLNGMGIKTVADLLRVSERDLMRQPNFGPKSMREIKEKILEPLNLTLPKETIHD